MSPHTDNSSKWHQSDWRRHLDLALATLISGALLGLLIFWSPIPGYAA